MEEAEFYADLISETEAYFNIKPGFIKVSIVFETLQSIIDIEEIIFALRKYAVSVNTGKWNYCFDVIKNFRTDRTISFPIDVSMHSSYMKFYSQKLVHVAHKRGLLALGGVSALIPRKG